MFPFENAFAVSMAMSDKMKGLRTALHVLAQNCCTWVVPEVEQSTEINLTLLITLTLSTVNNIIN